MLRVGRVLSSLTLLIVLKIGVCSDADGMCAAARRKTLRTAVLGRACGVHPTAALSGTMCAKARRARSIHGYELRIASARSLQGLLRSLRYREPVLVLFYGRHCRFSAKLLPVFASVTSRLPICSLAVEVKQLPALGAAFGVHGLPTTLRIQRGEANKRYSGTRTYDDMLEWATNVTYTRVGGARRAQRHHPLIHIAMKDNEPDWALVGSVTICVLAMVMQAVEVGRRKRQEEVEEGEGQ